MFLHEVNTGALETAWYALPESIGVRHPNRPLVLQADVRRVFDATQNSLMTKGTACRWLLYDDHNLPAARIAAFCVHDSPTGRIGFFECTNDQRAAQTVFDAAIRWLQRQGCTTIEGPVNFGEKDRFWGLMTAGANTKGLYLDNFNPPYYQTLFIACGFRPHEEIHTYKIDPGRLPVQRLEGMAAYAHKAGYRFAPFRWEQQERMAQDLHAVYTAAFSAHTRIGHLSVADIRGLLRSVRPLLHEEHCRIAYRQHIAAGFILFLKEPAPFNARTTMLKGFAFATIPSARAKGVEAGLCMSLYRQLRSEGRAYELYLSGINAKTTRMRSLIGKMGGAIDKIHQTFTYTIE